MSILNLNNPNLGINKIEVNNTNIFNTSKYGISNYLINAMNYNNIILSKNIDEDIASNIKIECNYSKILQEFKFNKILPIENNEMKYPFSNNVKNSIYKTTNNNPIQKSNYNYSNIKLISTIPETIFIWSHNYQQLNINNIQTQIKNLETIPINKYENFFCLSNNKDFLTHFSEIKNNTCNKSCYNNYNSNYEIHNMNTIKIESPPINFLNNKNFKNSSNNINFKQDHNHTSSYTVNNNNQITKIKKEALNKNEIKKLINKKTGENVIHNNKTKLNNTISKKIISKKTKNIKEKLNKFQYYIITNDKNNMESISIKECSNCKTRITPTWRRGKNDNLLCNACGLYEKQNNKSRPFKKLENGFTKIFKENNIIKHICANCKVEKSPTWRKGLNGQTLCNACGLFFKQHKSYRPCK